MTRLRCAVPDDYLNLALQVADWSKVIDRIDITVFNQPSSRSRPPLTRRDAFLKNPARLTTSC